MKLTRQKKIIVGLLALILSLMVGYALLSESLNIKGTASTGSSDFNIIFSAVNGIIEKGSNNATANVVDNGKKLEVKVPDLQYPTAYAEVDVTIKNEGELNAILTGIETQGLDNPDIKVSYSGVAQDEVLGAGQEKRMKIKVLWDEASTSNSASASFTITITYEQETTGEITTSPGTEQSDLFTWNGPTVVSGLTEKGIEYVKSHDGHLEIPEGVTEIASMDINTETGEIKSYKGFSPIAIGKLDPNDGSFGENFMNPEINIIKSVSFPSTLKKIGSYAFYYCVYLSGELVITDNVEIIDDHAFESTSIVSLKLGKDLRTIENSAFSNIISLTGELVIPNSVETIGNLNFNNNSITSLKLGNSIETIGDNVFYDCRNLTGELIIPDSVVTIGDLSFTDISVSTLKIGRGLETIGSNTFWNCVNLFGELYIPDNVKMIGAGAFKVDSPSSNKITSISISKSTLYVKYGGILESSSSFYNRPIPTIRE